MGGQAARVQFEKLLMSPYVRTVQGHVNGHVADYILIKQLEGFTQTSYFDADYNPNANNGGNSPSPSFFRNGRGTEPALAVR